MKIVNGHWSKEDCWREWEQCKTQWNTLKQANQKLFQQNSDNNQVVSSDFTAQLNLLNNQCYMLGERVFALKQQLIQIDQGWSRDLLYQLPEVEKPLEEFFYFFKTKSSVAPVSAGAVPSAPTQQTQPLQNPIYQPPATQYSTPQTRAPQPQQNNTPPAAPSPQPIPTSTYYPPATGYSNPQPPAPQPQPNNIPPVAPRNHQANFNPNYYPPTTNYNVPPQQGGYVPPMGAQPYPNMGFPQQPQPNNIPPVVAGNHQANFNPNYYPPTTNYNAPPQQSGYMPPMGAQPYPNTAFPQQPQPVKEKNGSLEQKIGGKITNIIGLLFILVAVALGLVYAFSVIESGLMKCIISYAIGVLFLGGGEILFRKKGSTFFGIGLSAVATAIFFTTTAIGTFALEAFSLPVALGLTGFFVLFTLFLSLYYKSELIGIFALIGGYVPAFFLQGFLAGLLAPSGLMVYYIILNASVLLVSGYKRWKVLPIFSVILSGIGTLFLWSEASMTLSVWNWIYPIAMFLIYVLVMGIGPLRRKENLRPMDLAILLFNTLFNYIFLAFVLDRWTKSQVMYQADVASIQWIASAIFAACFFAFYFVWKVSMPKDKAATSLFFVTGFTFLFWGTAQLLTSDLWSLGWMIEAAVLCIIGIILGNKLYRLVGVIGVGLASVLFCLLDTPLGLVYRGFYDPVYLWKYLVLTVGYLGIFGALVYKNRSVANFWSDPNHLFLRIFRFISLLNLWLFLEYFISYLFEVFVSTNASSGGWKGILLTLVTVVLSFVLVKMKWLRSQEIKVLSLCLTVFGILQLLVQNTHRLKFATVDESSSVVGILYLIVVVLIDLISIPYLASQINLWNNKLYKSSTPVITAFYALILSTIFSASQFNSDVDNIILSVIWVLGALIMVIYGFWKINKLMRITGLIVAFVAMAKVVFWDMAQYSLGQGARIISFLLFGFSFLGISMLYQYFNKRIPQDSEEIPQEQIPVGTKTEEEHFNNQQR